MPCSIIFSKRKVSKKMDNVKTILKSLREFKKPTILTLVFIIGEVFLEVLIPFITARTIDDINAGASMSDIGLTCGLMIVAAMASLACGALAGKTGAQASAGLAKNVRKDMYEKIQTFSFSNIDKFSTASLVTRMTTDITNMQNAYMMAIRTAARRHSHRRHAASKNAAAFHTLNVN